MKQTTEAIVLGLRKHSDKMSILHVYSRSEGRLALQVYGVHGKHKVRAAYHPLSIVEISFDMQPTRAMPTLANIDPVFLPEHVYSDIRRQSIALFVTEVLMLTLTHPMEDIATYEFLDDFVHELNDIPESENMHIKFLLQLTELLGIAQPEELSRNLLPTTPLTRASRQDILRKLCNYYLDHIDTFRLPKSLDILIEVFD